MDTKTVPVRYFNPVTGTGANDKVSDGQTKSKSVKRKLDKSRKSAMKKQSAAVPKPKSLKRISTKIKKGNKNDQRKLKGINKEKGDTIGEGLPETKRVKKGGNINKQNRTKKQEKTTSKIYDGTARPGKKKLDFENGVSNSKIQKLVIKPGGKWYENNPADEETKSSKTDEVSLHENEDIKPQILPLSKNELLAFRKSAEELLEHDSVTYKQYCLKGEHKADFQWMEKMIRIGTLPDKMAAYVVKIQDSPVHNIHHLQNLISMVKVQSRQQCLAAADTLKDLFIEDLLPSAKKLVLFDKRGSDLSNSTKMQLIKYMFEDRLKVCYSSFIDALRRMSLDNVLKIRAKSILIIYQLLSAHPEKEMELLQMLVNKLGDPIKKIASRALFYLNSLLENHPRMKMVVIDEVERLLFRNNMAKRAQYYGICFLNSINLNDEHPEVAFKLITVYIAFFKGCIKTGDIDSKMMSALLTGVNKAYPASKEYGFNFTDHVDTLYKIIHLSSFNIGVQALSILFHIIDVQSRPHEADRYYRTLYQEILRPEVSTTSHTVPFFNLIFKSMKCDDNENRVIGFCKRLLQICQNVQPNLACAILFMLSEISKAHGGIIRVGACPSLNLIREVVIEDENTNAEGNDLAENEMSDFMKISNVTIPSASFGIKTDHSRRILNTSSIDPFVKDEQLTVEGLNTASTNIAVDEKSSYKNLVTEYDPTARNPMYCGAEFSLSYEIVTLADHFHPSVSIFARSLLKHEPIVYEGNPLKDFTVSRFLERFVYKNSKKTKWTPGGLPSYQPKGLRNIPVNSVDYLRNSEDSIPAEEKFFYRYFKERKTSRLEAQHPDNSDTESIGDEEFDELMANYFKSKGKHDDDDDDDDLDSADEIDFAADIHSSVPVGKKRKIDADVTDDEVEDLENDEDAHGAAEDADDMLDMDDDDDLDFHDEDGLEVFEDDFEEELSAKKRKRSKNTSSSMFAPAEEFAEMLESNAEESLATGPSTLINRDNADPKQLHWELERDRWVKGYKGSSKTTFKNKRRMQKRK